MRHRRLAAALALALALALCGAAGAVRAQPSGERGPAGSAAPSSDMLDVPAERRCGFTFGLSAGGMFGEVEGFPNDVRKIDRLAYYTQQGAAGGQVGNWFGVAMADWFVFGLGGHYGAVYSDGLRTTFGGGDFHIDVFPAFSLGTVWRELGLDLEAGVAVSTTTRTDGSNTDVIQSGGASRIGAGIFYEGFRLWKLSMGPFASFDQIWSSSAYRPTAWLGWRTALYVGPYVSDAAPRSASRD